MINWRWSGPQNRKDPNRPCDIGPALRQAGYCGDAPLDIEVPHPRFGEAAESAAAGDREEALEAAAVILDGPEATAALRAQALAVCRRVSA